MKTQNFACGKARYKAANRRNFDGQACDISYLSDSVNAYYAARMNGSAAYAPPEPPDGKWSWTTPDESTSTVTYTEGPRDRAWMEKMDHNYILRLAMEGTLLEKEPVVLAEIRLDHAYRQEIAQAIYLARWHRDGDSRIVFDALQYKYKLAFDALADDEKLDPNVCSLEGISILLDSIQRKSMNRIKSLVARGADVNFKDPSGKTVLQIAVLNQEWEIVKVLLDSQYVDFTSIACEMLSPGLYYAVQTGDVELATKLLKHGANINAQDADEKTVLHVAILSKQPAMIDCLLAQTDIQLDIVSVEHRTALHYAAQLGDRDTVTKLLAKNANVLIKDGMNKAARDFAIEANHTAIAGLLLRAESTISASRLTDSSSLSKVSSVIPSSASPITLVANYMIPYSDLQYGFNTLGSGGFGKVYRGQWKMSDVAIKELHCQELNERTLAQFKDEAEVMYNLRHDRVVQLKGICLEPGHMSMVMELMPQGSLYSVLHNDAVELPWKLRWEISMDIAQGLAYLHSGKIIHRDLKSLNVLLDGNMRAKISDFGLSHVKDETKTKSTMKAEVGTMRWKAPEIMSAKPKYGDKSDVYAYAMVLWEIAARALPFAGAEDIDIKDDVKRGEREEIPEETPTLFANMITFCWAQQREARPTMVTICNELSALQQQGLFTDKQLKGTEMQMVQSLFSEQFSTI